MTGFSFDIDAIIEALGIHIDFSTFNYGDPSAWVEAAKHAFNWSASFALLLIGIGFFFQFVMYVIHSR
ncbi:MAG TPA: hypothetical protein V6C97_26430 [Oculatellaceae cyanobacterium]